MSEVEVREERLLPVRGLVALQNNRGKPYSATDLKRWIRINRLVYKTDKIDVLVAPGHEDKLYSLLEHAELLDVRLSLRTAAPRPPENLPELAKKGLFDVFLCPEGHDPAALAAWFEACRRVQLPVRLQLRAPFPADLDAEKLAQILAEGSVKVVNLAVGDPFDGTRSCRNADESKATIRQMHALATALDEHDVEVNLIGLPLCLIDEKTRVFAQNSQQFFTDHQQYHKTSYEMAKLLHRRGPITGSKIILILLAQHTSFRNPVDSKLFPWLAFRPWFNLRVWFFRKITRHMRIFRSTPKPRGSSADIYQYVLAETARKAQQNMGPMCRTCSLRRICDHDSPLFKEALPGVAVTAEPGELVLDPLRFCRNQRKYCDAVDRDRSTMSETAASLAKEAMELTNGTPPDIEVDSFEYKIEGQWTHAMPGGVRWFSVTNTEKVSSILTRTAPPLTVAVTFGGGMADYIGFSLGRHCKLVCPMIEYSHQLVLHVNAEGRYALLRDGVPVQPMEFEGAHYVPTRLGSVLEPRISVWNIDLEVVTQTVRIWQGAKDEAAIEAGVKYSVLIVSTRYARRLQAVLRSIARQEAFDFSRIEVVIAYVPGIDATDDLIDSMSLTYPELRIVRAPFSEENARSKGFMINEARRLASGEWIMLLDSDTILHPRMFSRIEEIEANCHFIAPDGRKMLSKDTTAAILLGEIDPQRQWNELLEGAGEFRLREAISVPIGFCQCIRAECLAEIPYEELDHFEGADWRFGVAVRQKYGREKRLSGIPVMHLDHGGSQWYGTKKHM